MYKPKFNSVLVEIDDVDAKWGGENNENMLGKSYSKGTAISASDLYRHDKMPWATEEESKALAKEVKALFGKQIMWNEGTEAGTTFEEDGKLYGFIYWWDIRGVKE